MIHNSFVHSFDFPEESYGRSSRTALSSSGKVKMLNDIPALALPEALRGRLSSRVTPKEPNLRRLMENNIYGQKLFSDSSRVYQEHLQMDSVRRLRQKTLNGDGQPSAEGWKDHRVFSVSDSGLRAVLNKTSNCAVFESLERKEYIASGWTKAVYKAVIRRNPVALKTVDLSGHDMVKCGQQLADSWADCYTSASQKILKELLLLRALSVPNVVKVSNVLENCICSVNFFSAHLRT